jgi:hypothetical protein
MGYATPKACEAALPAFGVLLRSPCFVFIAEGEAKQKQSMAYLGVYLVFRRSLNIRLNTK